MIRVVRGPDGTVFIDEKGKQSGRGAYVCPEPQCVVLCLKKKLLERSLKTAIPLPVRERLCVLGHVDNQDLSDQTTLRDELGSLLGLARRAGEIIIGQDRVLEAVLSHKKLLILLSSDHSENVKKALDMRQIPSTTLTTVDRTAMGEMLGLRQTQIVAFPAGSGFAEKARGLLSEGGNVIE